MRRRWLIIFLAIATLVISRLVWQQLQPDTVVPLADTPRFAYRIDDLVLTILDPAGKEQLIIRSPLLVDAGEGRPSELSEPVVTAPNSADSWQLTARTALIDRHNEHVTLIDDVVLISLNRAEPIRVETSHAELDIQTKTLHSPEMVTITQPGVWLQGLGLSGNLESANYELQQDVHAQFDDRNGN